MTANLRKTVKDLVGDAKSRVENLTPEQVQEELENSDVLLVDVRDSEERQQNGTIPGAVHITRGMLEFRADPNTPYYNPEVRPDRRIILHCASGGRSALSAQTLKEMGYENVAHLDGGVKAWREAGKPIDKNS